MADKLTPGFSRIDGGEVAAVGLVGFARPDGTVERVVSMSARETSICTRRGEAGQVGILAMRATGPAGETVAALHIEGDATILRGLGAALVNAANRLDPAGVQ